MTGLGRISTVGILCVAAAMSAGCGGREMVLNAELMDQGLVIVLPGIDGRAWHSEAVCHTLVGQGVAKTVVLHDWTSPLLGPLFNQMAVDHNRQMAMQLAARIAAYKREHPDGPVYLIGHSGGTAIAVWAAEGLPDNMQIEGIVLLASSLSPGYALTEALQHTRQGIVSFYSDMDVALLGAGTTIFGTMDGVPGESAGKVGFNGRNWDPDGGRLYQVPWDESMAEVGYGGDHFSCLTERFVGSYVAPLMCGRPSWARMEIGQAMAVASAGGG